MAETIETQCAIAGGGPAGIMLGFLLARSGVDVVVLEKWPDFFRDFRGDTIHPSTMEIMHELGLLDAFLTLPVQRTKEITGFFGEKEIPLVDFTHLPTKAQFLGFVPQWDFLNFISEEGKKYSGFTLLMESEVTGLVSEGERVTGLTAETTEGELTIRAPLVVGADGRHSTVRDAAELPVNDLGAPLDVLWFKISRSANEHTNETLFRMKGGAIFIMMNRDDYWQCAYVIKKGGIDEVKSAGIETFRKRVADIAPNTAEKVHELRSFDDIKLLTVSVDRLKQWSKEGLLIIGDAAHAMSPVAGVGVNLAVQDAVAAANILVPAFESGAPTEADLQKVEERRRRAISITQRVQIFIHEHIVMRVLENTDGKTRVPFSVRLFKYIPLLRRLPARFIGIGIQPEHVHTKEVKDTKNLERQGE